MGMGGRRKGLEPGHDLAHVFEDAQQAQGHQGQDQQHHQGVPDGPPPQRRGLLHLQQVLPLLPCVLVQPPEPDLLLVVRPRPHYLEGADGRQDTVPERAAGGGGG